MNALTLATGSRLRPATTVESAFRRRILGVLGGLSRGRIRFQEGERSTEVGGGDPLIEVNVLDPAFWSEVGTGGTVGAGGAWISGSWTCTDPVGLIRLLLRERPALERLEGGLARIALPFLRWWHARRANTRDQARRNIAAHYDLGNDFFATWLDPTMLYSSAVYDEGDDLYAAQIRKCERLCRMLDLRFDDHLLEIGTGWGGFAIHAAQTYGCRVTTTTISRRQYDLARERVRTAGLEGRIQVLLKDYRDLDGRFDKLVSIEMIEAVGHDFYDDYFRTCARLLKDDGLFAMQAITIAERLHAQALRSVDFIQRYIFPGSCIPSVSALTASCGRASDFDLVGFDDITPHYARTLADWRLGFHGAGARIRTLGHDESFLRAWDFYLAYCEAGFAERSIGCAHLLFARNAWRSVDQLRLDRR